MYFHVHVFLYVKNVHEFNALSIQQMEMKLSVYDELLSSVRVSMSKLSKDYSAIMIWDRNLKALLEQVADIVVSLD